MSPEIEKAHSKAKIALMQHADSAFFTTVLFSLKHKWNTNIPTACTNGLTIMVNPNFFMSLNVQERVFLLLHEAMHVVFMHVERAMLFEGINAKKYNIAGDHVINLLLKERGYQMPQGGYADPLYKGMSTEEVYDLLEDIDDDFGMDLMPVEGDIKDFKDTVDEILVRASIQSKIDKDKQGTIPSEIAVYIDKLVNPTLPWNQILRKYLSAKIKNDYSWSKPNRRFFPEYYLPSMYSEGLCEIAVAIDASGSVSDKDFSVFVKEVQTILKTLKPSAIQLITFDTEIKSIVKLKTVEELNKVEFHGRGGTLVSPVIDWANQYKPRVLLVFTDGYIESSLPRCRTDLVWLIHNNDSFVNEQGKVIKYKIEG